MGVPEWIAILVACGAAAVGTLTRHTIRIVSLTIMAIALIGLVVSLYKKDEARNQTAQNIGNNNTIVSAPVPQSMGNNNTIVGGTDQNRNSIINRGGTTIGSKACGDPTSVVIGAGARQAACAPQQSK
jgi:hypothetical protein